MSTDIAEALSKISTINSVEGFDPTPLAVDYQDPDTGEKRKRLPVMIQIAWFRLKYPDGRFTFEVKSENDCFIARARVYTHYALPLEQYLSEATASRGFLPEKPTVSPREWAQTAALGIALRNAGFGLQFHAAGEPFDNTAVNELGEISEPSPTPDAEVESPNEGATASLAEEPVSCSSELTFEESLTAATNMPCPISRYKERTLGEMIAIDPKALVWVASKYQGNAALSAAAKLICEHSLESIA